MSEITLFRIGGGWRRLIVGDDIGCSRAGLRAQGCDEFQGFLLSEPLLPDAAAEIMRRHPAEDLAITRRLRTLTRER